MTTITTSELLRVVPSLATGHFHALKNVQIEPYETRTNKDGFVYRAFSYDESERDMFCSAFLVDKGYTSKIHAHSETYASASMRLPQGKFLIAEQANMVHTQEGHSKQVVNTTVVSRDTKERSYDINQRNTKGQTLLHLAARSDNYMLVFWLLQHGVDITIRDNNGLTADDMHFVNQSSESALMVKVLDNHKAAQIAALGDPYYDIPRSNARKL